MPEELVSRVWDECLILQQNNQAAIAAQEAAATKLSSMAERLRVQSLGEEGEFSQEAAAQQQKTFLAEEAALSWLQAIPDPTGRRVFGKKQQQNTPTLLQSEGNTPTLMQSEGGTRNTPTLLQSRPDTYHESWNQDLKVLNPSGKDAGGGAQPSVKASAKASAETADTGRGITDYSTYYFLVVRMIRVGIST